MSIQGKVKEIDSIKKELKTLRDRGSVLRKRIKVIEQEIEQYLDAKDQPGLKYKGIAIIRENKQKRRIKKKNEQREDAIYVLEKYGIDRPEKVFDEIMEARRGSPTNEVKFTYKKYEDKV